MELATSREAGDKRTKTKAVITINQSTNQPINQSTNQPINQLTNQPINQSTNQPNN